MDRQGRARVDVWVDKMHSWVEPGQRQDQALRWTGGWDQEGLTGKCHDRRAGGAKMNRWAMPTQIWGGA